MTIFPREFVLHSDPAAKRPIRWKHTDHVLPPAAYATIRAVGWYEVPGSTHPTSRVPGSQRQAAGIVPPVSVAEASGSTGVTLSRSRRACSCSSRPATSHSLDGANTSILTRERLYRATGKKALYSSKCFLRFYRPVVETFRTNGPSILHPSNNSTFLGKQILTRHA
jgi:hypothetical protein